MNRLKKHTKAIIMFFYFHVQIAKNHTKLCFSNKIKENKVTSDQIYVVVKKILTVSILFVLDCFYSNPRLPFLTVVIFAMLTSHSILLFLSHFSFYGLARAYRNLIAHLRLIMRRRLSTPQPCNVLYRVLPPPYHHCKSKTKLLPITHRLTLFPDQSFSIFLSPPL